MNQTTSGQLYRCRIVGRNEDTSTEVDFLVVGTSVDDALLRLPYCADLSEFETYSVESTVKVGQAWEARRNVIKRAGGTISVGQFGEQKRRPKFVVTATTACHAKDMQQAIDKMLDRIASRSNSVRVSAEMVAEASGYAMPRDVSIFPRASFVAG